MKSSFVLVAFGIALMARPVNAESPAPAEPGQASTQAPAAQPPRPFPEGAKYAYVNVQRIAAESKEGQAATAKITSLREQKEKELQAKNTEVENARKKLETSGSVLSESARTSQQKDLERLQIDLQRMTQDAQAAIQDLQNDLQVEFQRKLLPVIGNVAAAKGLHLVFSSLDSGLIWAEPGLDITADVVKLLDSPAKQ